MEAPLEKLQSALSGRYNVVREIGEGGMATVFLARDVKHDRHVALKLLKPELGAVLGVERFLSEIKVTANLQHPHLLPLFDSGEAEGLLFYVMPFVEGESLRKRLDREHQLPIDEALRITLAVASALDYAHKQGVVHRDLKPENILLQHGEPVVSDFGIALAVSKAGGARVTQTGLSLGTPQYMSPEQATGDRDVDARSDIYSLAAVAYEMLTGEPPHSGKTAQAIIARVLTEKAHSTRVMRDTVPEHVDLALLKALSKLPADRFASAAEFSTALKHAGSVGSTAPFTSGVPRVPTSTRSRLIAAVPWALAAALGAALVLRQPAAPPEQPIVRLQQPYEQTTGLVPEVSSIAVSPDGRFIAITPTPTTGSGIQLRSLADTTLRELPGTNGGRLGQLTFSPDGREIAFARAGKLWRVGLDGSPPRPVADLPASVIGLTWGADDQIVSGGTTLMSVSASGGEFRTFARPDSAAGEPGIRFPRFLPDGRTLVAHVGSVVAPKLAVITLRGEITRFPVTGRAPRFVHPGVLVFDDGNRNVLAVPFDPASYRIGGDPVIVASEVPLRNTLGVGSWDVSPSGTFVQFASSALRLLTLVNRNGAATLLHPEAGYYRRPVVSASGDRIAVELSPGGLPGPDSDIWIFNRSLATLSRLTIGLGAQDPMWMRDGRRVAFSVRDPKAPPTQGLNVWVQPADGSSAAIQLSKAPGQQWPYGTSPDDNLIIVDHNLGGGQQVSIGVIDLKANPDSVRPLVADSAFSNRLVQVSPDGKWLAYISTRTGTAEVYVRPINGGGNWLVSNGGGSQVLWNPNGRELFYRVNGKVISATIRTSPQFDVLERRELFDGPYYFANSLDWAVLPSGNEFVMLKPEAAQRTLAITVNWGAEVRAKLGASVPR
jgi:serine/threonine protein kinase/Tol biopolymer transport system component